MRIIRTIYVVKSVYIQERLIQKLFMIGNPYVMKEQMRCTEPLPTGGRRTIIQEEIPICNDYSTTL